MIGLGFIIALGPVALLIALGVVAWKLLSAAALAPRAELRAPQHSGTPRSDIPTSNARHHARHPARHLTSA